MSVYPTGAQIMLPSFLSYSCNCPSGWKGAFCTETVSTCDPEHDPPHHCSKGATCVSLPHGYTCHCPLGTTGVYCEQGEAQLMLSTDLSEAVSFWESEMKSV